MKLFNFKSLFAALILSAVTFSACSESTSPTPNGNKPNAPTDLMATSKDANSILIKWTPSTSESNSNFTGYWVTVTPGLFQPQMISKGQNPFSIPNLDEGTVYTINVSAVAGSDTSTAATVMWSPASRFVNDVAGGTVKLYERSSSKGSGLQLFNGTGPANLTVANKANWDIAFDTENDSLIVGAAAAPRLLDIGSGSPTRITQVSSDFFDNVQSLDDVFDSNALSTYDFSKNGGLNVLDLKSSSINANGGVVIIARTKANSSATEWNYAKIFIKRVNGQFLQGASGNRYIEVEVSYQHKAGVPYARPRS